MVKLKLLVLLALSSPCTGPAIVPDCQEKEVRQGDWCCLEVLCEPGQGYVPCTEPHTQDTCKQCAKGFEQRDHIRSGLRVECQRIPAPGWGGGGQKREHPVQTTHNTRNSTKTRKEDKKAGYSWLFILLGCLATFSFFAVLCCVIWKCIIPRIRSHRERAKRTSHVDNNTEEENRLIPLTRWKEDGRKTVAEYPFALLGKKTGPSKYFHLLKKCRNGQSVCIIHTADTTTQYGSGFLVGDYKIMTCVHVMSQVMGFDMNLSQEEIQRTVEENISKYAVTFDYNVPFSSHEATFRFRSRVCWIKKELDTIILELDCQASHQQLPPALVSFGDVGPNEKFDAYGHPGGKPKEVDEELKIFEKDNCKQLSDELFDFVVKNADREVAETYPPPYPDSIIDTWYLYDGTMEHGSSGGPGICITDTGYKVIFMIVGTLPVFLNEDRFENLKQKLDPKFIMHFGIPMSMIFRQMKVDNIVLCKEIFQEFPSARDM